MNKKSIIISIIVEAILIAIASYVSYSVGLYAGLDQGYTDACQDCYNEMPKYVLVENPNGEKQWKKIKAWDDKNYFDSKVVSCPKCGSTNIESNGQRGRMPIFSWRCKACWYVWKNQ